MGILYSLSGEMLLPFVGPYLPFVGRTTRGLCPRWSYATYIGVDTQMDTQHEHPMSVRRVTAELAITRYQLARICGVSTATVYASWGVVVPRRHWARLVAYSGGRLAMPATAGHS